MSMTNGHVRTVTSERAKVRWTVTHRLRQRRPLPCVRHHEATARRIEIENLGIAAPVNRRLNLAPRLIFAELLVEHVEEEVFGNGVVAFGFQCPSNLPQEQNVSERSVAK